VPTDEELAGEGLRTIPPRETAGNIDIKQLSPGTTVLLPVYAEGGLVSTGDVHYAQGDCEACGTAIEVRTRVHLRFGIRKGEAGRRGIRDLQYFRDDYFTPPELAAPHSLTCSSRLRRLRVPLASCSASSTRSSLTTS
jgi:formamidase